MNTNMKCPLSQGTVSLIGNMKYDKNNGEVSSLKSSPWKSNMAALLKPQDSTCVKAISFDDGELVKSSSNKENTEEARSSGLPESGDLENESCLCVQEDSGYLSLHNSHIEPEDHESGAAESCGTLQGGTSQRLLALAPSREASPSHPNLPIVQFQYAVCKELAKSYSKTRGFNWAAVSRLAGDFGLQNVIGGKMGLEYVDILQALLERDMKHILSKILSLLEETDLINFKRVSKSWLKVLSQDTRALDACRMAEQRLWESKRPVPLTTRDLAASRAAFSCLQASTPTPKSRRTQSQKDCKQSKNSALRTRFSEFQEAASALKQHEGLKPCRLCGSPARYDTAALRATCTRLSCGFNFCSRCLCQYHGSSPCLHETGGSSRATLRIGSARSKRNIKRL